MRVSHLRKNMQGMEEVMINSCTGTAPVRVSHLRKYMQGMEAVMTAAIQALYLRVSHLRKYM